MVQLQDVKLVSAVRPSAFDPISTKRLKFSSKVNDQLECALAMKSGEIYKKSVTRFVSDLETDEKEVVITDKKINPWWWIDKDGKYLMTIKYGTKTLELVKGKSAVQADTLDQIIEVLKSLKLATTKGDMDLILATAGDNIRKRFKHSK